MESTLDLDLLSNLTTAMAVAEPNYTGLYIALGITLIAILFCAVCLILACCGCAWWTCCDEDDWN